MREVKLKEILTESKIISDKPNPDRRLRVKLNVGGVEKRPMLKDSGTTKYYVRKAGQFIYGRQNLFKGAFGVVPVELDNYESSTDLPTFDVSDECSVDWIIYFLLAGERYKHLEAISKGSGSKRIHPKDFLELKIPLPPEEEQNSFIEHFKKLQEKHSQTLEELQTQSELIIKLRSSILSDAVSGRLVPQDPNDESAEVLLEKIKAEKEKLIKEGKIKKQKPLPPISEDEIPYELPDGWVWCRLSNVCKNIHYGYTASAEQTCDEPKMLRITDIQNNSVNWERVPHCKISDEEMEKYLLKERDILVARTGGTVGKSFLMTNVPVKSVFASYLIRLIPSNFINEQYLKLILESPLYWKQIIAKSMGTGQPNVNGTSLGELVMSFPALEEQKRIVEKVEKLMSTCDALELEVQNSKTETEKLMQSVLKEAFEK